MKSRTFITAAVALTITASAIAAQAAPGFGFKPKGPRGQGHPPGAAAHHGPQGEHRGRSFERLDTDGSGNLTLDEFLARPLAKAEQQFGRQDADEDGLISLDEFIAGVPDDADLPEDAEAIRACISEALDIEIPVRPDPESTFAAIDANADGFIDQAEMTDAKTASVTERFNDLDTDTDSVVSPEELEAAMQSRRDHREVHRECVEEARALDEALDA